MKKSSPVMTWLRIAAVAVVILLFMATTSCKKDSTNSGEQTQDAIERYSSVLPAQTIQELKDAKAATQRYRVLDSAKADGYSDISVVVENMGFHYMKASLADTIFDPKKPELLVYNKMHDGKIELVAVEYAVPIPLMPNKEPQGFTGSADVWTYSTTFNLWLLHAWVWEYNPYGMFVPNNPNVHLH
jgi:hypothetical protein